MTTDYFDMNIITIIIVTCNLRIDVTLVTIVDSLRIFCQCHVFEGTGGSSFICHLPHNILFILFTMLTYFGSLKTNKSCRSVFTTSLTCQHSIDSCTKGKYGLESTNKSYKSSVTTPLTCQHSIDSCTKGKHGLESMNNSCRSSASQRLSSVNIVMLVVPKGNMT